MCENKLYRALVNITRLVVQQRSRGPLCTRLVALSRGSLRYHEARCAITRLVVLSRGSLCSRGRATLILPVRRRAAARTRSMPRRPRGKGVLRGRVRTLLRLSSRGRGRIVRAGAVSASMRARGSRALVLAGGSRRSPCRRAAVGSLLLRYKHEPNCIHGALYPLEDRSRSDMNSCAIIGGGAFRPRRLPCT